MNQNLTGERVFLKVESIIICREERAEEDVKGENVRYGMRVVDCRFTANDGLGCAHLEETLVEVARRYRKDVERFALAQWHRSGSGGGGIADICLDGGRRDPCSPCGQRRSCVDRGKTCRVTSEERLSSLDLPLVDCVGLVELDALSARVALEEELRVTGGEG